MTKKTAITLHLPSDQRLARMARGELARERGCSPEEVGNIELFRELALSFLEEPEGVSIRLNGEGETFLKALQSTDETEPERALARVAESHLKLQQREQTTADGARYTGASQ